MSRGRHSRRYRRPTEEEDTKIFHKGYSLSELFDDDEIFDLMVLARSRVIGEFHYATDFIRGKYRSTDNYITSIGGKLKDLAAYVNRSMHRPFITKQQLPSDLQDLPPSLIERVVARAQYDILLLTLQKMRYQEVWFDEALGIWQVCQSSVDSFLEYHRVGERFKVDRRNYHGRPRNQTRRRGIPEGTSIGLS